MNVLAGITIAMLVVGWTYMAINYPVRLPQQTDWFAPKFISSGEKMAEVEPEGATYNAFVSLKVAGSCIFADMPAAGRLGDRKHHRVPSQEPQCDLSRRRIVSGGDLA